MSRVIPLPAAVRPGRGEMRLTSGSAVGFDDASLGSVAAGFVADVAADTGLRFDVGRGAGTSAIRLVRSASFAAPASPIIGVSPTGGDARAEAHRIQVTSEHITVEASTAEGIFRALTTVRQLVAGGLAEGEARIAAVGVDDVPRFAWRGLSLDVVRTFHAPARVRRVIDIMALYKLNVLHLHLSDDQGWRIEIPGWPELTTVGAAGAMGDRPGGFYTQEEYSELVRYAGERYITVVPEIDMPGHCAAAVSSYPELGSSANTLDPDRPRVLEFVRDVVGVMAGITRGPFLHIGGDEAFGMELDAYARFVDAARRIVVDAGKRPVLWQESARSTTAPTDIVQYWMAFDAALEELLLSDRFDGREMPDGVTVPAEFLPHIAEMFRLGKADVVRAVDRGAPILLSPASHVYLDRPYAEPPTDPGQADFQRRLGLKVYSRMSVAQSFDWDPATVIEAEPEALAGVEAAMWCETVATGPELEFMLLPRLVGVAERAWSQQPASTWEEYRDRLGAQAPLWSARQWTFFTSSLVDWAD